MENISPSNNNEMLSVHSRLLISGKGALMHKPGSHPPPPPGPGRGMQSRATLAHGPRRPHKDVAMAALRRHWVATATTSVGTRGFRLRSVPVAAPPCPQPLTDQKRWDVPDPGWGGMDPGQISGPMPLKCTHFTACIFHLGKVGTSTSDHSLSAVTESRSVAAWGQAGEQRGAEMPLDKTLQTGAVYWV